MPAEMCAASCSRSPSATRAATGSGSAPLLRRAGEIGKGRSQHVGRAEGAGKPHAPAARQAECRQHRLEDGLVAERDLLGMAGQRKRQQRMGVGYAAGVGRGRVAVAEILDAGLEELVAALAALAEHLAEIGIAARRVGLRADVVEADGNGEFRTQAERLAGLAFGEENAAAKVLAGHVEKRVGRLDDGHVDGVRLRASRRGRGWRGRWMGSGRSWALARL